MLMSALEKAQDFKELLTELFSSANYFSSPFRGLETNYLQQQYFIKEFGMIVSTFASDGCKNYYNGRELL